MGTSTGNQTINQLRCLVGKNHRICIFSPALIRWQYRSLSQPSWGPHETHFLHHFHPNTFDPGPRCVFRQGAPALAGDDASPDAIPDLVGTYSLNGFDPSGKEYGGC